MQHVEHNNGQIAKQAKRSCTKKRLVTKLWDKTLFDMRMELGKGHYENLSIQYTENFVSIKY